MVVLHSQAKTHDHRNDDKGISGSKFGSLFTHSVVVELSQNKLAIPIRKQRDAPLTQNNQLKDA